MNWISQNKFMAGFIGVMFVGVAALGILLFQAISQYGDVHADYTRNFQQLQALQKRVPYPNPENLDNYRKQQDELNGFISDLEQNMSKLQFPLDATVTPQKFQADLQDAVHDAAAKAAANNIQIPDKFALGFDQYLTSPPIQTAAPALDRQLKAMQFLFDEFLDGSGVKSISAVVRAPLSEEKTEEKTEVKKGNKPQPAPSLVVKAPVEITFIADMLKMRKIMNDLVETKKQFYIVRLVNIATTEDADKPITKQDAMKNPTSPNGAPRFVLGDEKLQVTLSLEIVNFNAPAQK